MAWAINTLSNWKSVLTDFWTWLVRPGELRNVQEGHINLQEKWIVFPQPRKRDPKFIHLLPQHCELIQSIWPPRALPHIYFFRHLTSRSGIRAGDRFGQKYLKPWWDRACKNLGITGVDLYGGTKHSTVTALGKTVPRTDSAGCHRSCIRCIQAISAAGYE